MSFAAADSAMEHAAHLKSRSWLSQMSFSFLSFARRTTFTVTKSRFPAHSRQCENTLVKATTREKERTAIFRRLRLGVSAKGLRVDRAPGERPPADRARTCARGARGESHTRHTRGRLLREERIRTTARASHCRGRRGGVCAGGHRSRERDCCDRRRRWRWRWRRQRRRDDRDRQRRRGLNRGQNHLQVSFSQRIVPARVARVCICVTLVRKAHTRNAEATPPSAGRPIRLGSPPRTAAVRATPAARRRPSELESTAVRPGRGDPGSCAASWVVTSACVVVAESKDRRDFKFKRRNDRAGFSPEVWSEFVREVPPKHTGAWRFDGAEWANRLSLTCGAHAGSGRPA